MYLLTKEPENRVALQLPDKMVDRLVCPCDAHAPLALHKDHFVCTHAGLRRLMRHFTEVCSGAANGPAMAMCWSIWYCMTSLSERRLTRSLLSNFTRLLIWPLRYPDRRAGRLRGVYDCAPAFYFFGQRSVAPISDRDIIKGYRGLKWWRD